MESNEPVLLQVNHLKTCFSTEDGNLYAVNDVSFDVKRGEILGIVGESGSGKSVTAFSIMGLLAKNGWVEAGEVLFNGRSIANLPEREMQKLRGNKISMIFQEPMTCLNPVYTVGFQLNESIMYHQGLSKEKATKRSIEMLHLVGIPDPEERIRDYPHQLSGGMRQRVMIAMGIACNPDLLIADEPTTALDVTIQAQILNILVDLKNQLKGTSIILITHDMGVVAEVCDRVAVMYAGKIVEIGSTRELFKNPKHWYTAGLLRSIPQMDETRDRLPTIQGSVPNLQSPPSGCRFHPRCEGCTKQCETEQPEFIQVDRGHFTACHNLYQKREG